MRRRLAVLLIFWAAAGFAQTAAKQPTQPDASTSAEQQLMEADRDFARATAQRRVEGWMQYMADNAVILRAAPIVGKDAIREAYNKLFADPTFTLTWEPTKAEAFPPYDLGYTVGKFSSSHRVAQCGGSTVTSHGTYLTTWQKQKDGSWKVIADIGSVQGSTGGDCSP